MKRGLILLAVLLALLSFVGCATTEGYKNICDSWLGHNIDKLINSWGYPQGSFKAPNGNMVYVYEHGGSLTLPESYSATTYGYGYFSSTTVQKHGGQTITFWCRTFFEVDENNIIIIYRFEGNNCVAYEER